MGWHGSALTVGLAVGSPLAGAAIDHGSPSWGFAAVGLVGVLTAAALLLVRHLEPAIPAAATAPAATAEAAHDPAPAG